MPKDYLNVARPAHFRMRPDLIDELCIPDEMIRALPRNAQQYAAWKRLCDFEDSEAVTYADLMPFMDKPYEPSRRYLLHPCVLPGDDFVTRLVCDRRGWKVQCLGRGLYDFVFRRAAEFMVSHGWTAAKAYSKIWPKIAPNDGSVPQYAEWVIGYECHSGECTFLIQGDPGTEARYLQGVGGYLFPQFDGAIGGQKS